MVKVERWRPVVGFEGLYEVSDRWRVRSLDRETEFTGRWGKSVKRLHPGRVLRPSYGSNGRGTNYYSLGLSCEGEVVTRRVHVLVLEAFHGLAPEGCEGAHEDGDTRNNAVANLKWKTSQQNALDRVRHGTQTRKSGCCPQDPATGRFYKAAA